VGARYVSVDSLLFSVCIYLVSWICCSGFCQVPFLILLLLIIPPCLRNISTVGQRLAKHSALLSKPLLGVFLLEVYPGFRGAASDSLDRLSALMA
jgi:hypothetical protein